MSVDASKIKAGDKGTIEVTFLSPASEVVCVGVKTVGASYSVMISTSMIASHTPAPWVPEKDDVVAWNASGHTEWKIRAVDGGAAWICHSVSGNAVAFLSDLTFIRKGAA